MQRLRARARTVLGVIALAALALEGCTPARPTETPAAFASPRPTTASSSAATFLPATAGPTPSPAVAGSVGEQAGARLEMTPTSATVEAGHAVTFTVALTNQRSTPLQFGWERIECFVVAYVQAFIPLDPVGRTDWTGEAADFKDRILNGTGGPPGHTYVEPLSTGYRLQDSPCVERDGVAQPLAPGETTSTTFTWTASFGDALPVAPPYATFQALAFVSTFDTLVTVPPPPTSFPAGRWVTRFPELWVTGTVGIGGETRAMASLGEVVDGALADETFRTFITEHPVGDCLVSLQLPSEQGRYLPAGPGWNLEELCERPRRFIRAEIDPWTAEVKGLDICDRCGR